MGRYCLPHRHLPLASYNNRPLRPTTESKRNRVFKSLAVKEARKKHEEDAAREASFEAVSEASTEDEDQEESEEEGSSSEGEATDDAAPPILPRSAPTPVVMTSSPYASAESVSLAPPDDGAYLLPRFASDGVMGNRPNNRCPIAS